MKKLIIKRKPSIRYIFRVPFKIYVDGNEIGSIYPSEEVNCDLKEGKHTIIISSNDKTIEQGIIIEKETNCVEIVVGSIRIFTIYIPQIRDIIFK
ncbi:MAG: hypothetical protein IK137_00890 [Bacilli bacterium]|nr:hypothetical protein [Bacilli bacterium]